MRKLLLLLLLVYAVPCAGQKAYGVEQDYYVYQRTGNSLVPSVYWQTKNNWYGVMRYNYEDDATVSFHAGKVFSKEGGVISASVTPLAGFMAGRFNGVSAGAQTEMGVGRFSFYTEPQYCVSVKSKTENFFYNWSELSFQPIKFFYAGLALQQTGMYGEKFFNEPGLMAGIVAGKFEVPFYCFNPGQANQCFVVGLHWNLEK